MMPPNFLPVKTKAWARREGFTHEGLLFGIPIWIKNPYDTVNGPDICAKNWFWEVLLDLGDLIFDTCVYMGWIEPVFSITIGARIDRQNQ